MKDIHDFGPSALIRSSEGPENNVQRFYSTTYSLAHKGLANGSPRAIPNRPGDLSKSKLPITFVKRKTGYTSNLNPFVVYDRAVDEADFKIGNDSYLSSTEYSYQAPPHLISIKKSTEKVIPSNYDSGFTHLPDTRKNVRFSASDFNSIMNSSYSPNVWKFKSSSVDRAKILSSSSSFVIDRGEIDFLGSYNAIPARYVLPTPKPAKTKTKTFQLKEDGFVRSGRRNTMLSDGYNREQDINNLEKPIIDKLKKLDYPSLIHMLDPNSTQSTSQYVLITNINSIVHPFMNPVKDTVEMQKSGNIIIGNKETSGSVKDTPVKLPEIEASPGDRFSSETSRRFAYPAFKFDQKNIDCGIIRNSAFGRNFAFRYTHPCKTDQEIYESLHPSVAKGRWQQEKGLHTAQPTETPYTLVIE